MLQVLIATGCNFRQDSAPGFPVFDHTSTPLAHLSDQFGIIDVPRFQRALLLLLVNALFIINSRRGMASLFARE